MTPGEKRSKQHNTVLIPVMALTADPLCDQPHRNPALHAPSPPAMATDVGHRGCTPSRNSSLCCTQDITGPWKALRSDGIPDSIAFLTNSPKPGADMTKSFSLFKQFRS